MTAPITALAMALWDTWVPRRFVLRAWVTASMTAAGAASTWRSVRGPVSAALASAKRLGWQCSEVGRFTTPEGVVLDLASCCPRTIEFMAWRATEKYLLTMEAERQRHLHHLGGIPWLQPLRALVRSRTGSSWTVQHQGVLKAVAANGIWTQDRFFEAGMVASSACQACGMQASLWHRPWGCFAMEQFVREYSLPAAVKPWARRSPHLPLWTHGLLPDPRGGLPLPTMEPIYKWNVVPPSGSFEGAAHGDGSALFGSRDEAFTRCGWCVVQVEKRGALVHCVASLHGPLPGPLQTSPAAEAFGLLAYVLHAGMPPYIYHTDCQWVASSYLAGPSATAGAQHVHADIWRRVWRKVTDLGGAHVLAVVKVKAHSTMLDVENGRIGAVDRIANSMADIGAKKAATMHPNDPAVMRRCERTWQVITMVSKFLSRLHLHAVEWGGDVTQRDQRTRLQAAGAARLTVLRRAPSDHTILFQNGRYRCQSCWRSAKLRSTIVGQPCVPRRTHWTYECGQFIFCGRCGAYSRKAARLLLRPCKSRPPRNSHGYKSLRAFAAGRSPVDGSFCGHALPTAGQCADVLLPGLFSWERGRHRIWGKTLPGGA